jgi:hypothetical protein
MNRNQQHLIEYLIEENRVLREQIGNRRMRFNDNQRRRLASKAKKFTRKVLARISTIVTPETLLAAIPKFECKCGALRPIYFRSIKEGCLDQFIFFGEDSPRNAIREFVTYYHVERNHQGLVTGLSFQSRLSWQRVELSEGDNGSAECSTFIIETPLERRVMHEDYG